jgi:hypothetical protein
LWLGGFHCFSGTIPVHDGDQRKAKRDESENWKNRKNDDENNERIIIGMER